MDLLVEILIGGYVSIIYLELLKEAISSVYHELEK